MDWKKHPGIEKWDMEQIGHLILFHHFLLQVKRPSGEDVSFFFRKTSEIAPHSKIRIIIGLLGLLLIHTTDVFVAILARYN